MRHSSADYCLTLISTLFLVTLPIISLRAHASDSTNIVKPAAFTQRVFCAVPPNVNDRNQCIPVSQTFTGTAQTFSQDIVIAKIYIGAFYRSTNVSALCSTQANGFNMFGGLISKTFSTATGLSISPVDFLTENLTYYCCRPIMQWVNIANCYINP